MGMFKRVMAEIKTEVDHILEANAKSAGMSKKAYLEKLINDDAEKSKSKTAKKK